AVPPAVLDDLVESRLVQSDLIAHAAAVLIRESAGPGTVGIGRLNRAVEDVGHLFVAHQELLRAATGRGHRLGRLPRLRRHRLTIFLAEDLADLLPRLPHPRSGIGERLGRIGHTPHAAQGRPVEGDQHLPGEEVRGPLPDVELRLLEPALHVGRHVTTDLRTPQILGSATSSPWQTGPTPAGAVAASAAAASTRGAVRRTNLIMIRPSNQETVSGSDLTMS